MMLARLVVPALVCLTLACSTTSDAGPPGRPVIADASSGSNPDAGLGLETQPPQDAAAEGARPRPQGLPSLGSLVVLGDSISSGGGEPPYYFDVLRASLAARYGAIAFQNNATSGSTTGDLLRQIGELPSSLPGPVAIVITSGSNDGQLAMGAVATGTDGPMRVAMGENIDAARSRVRQRHPLVRGLQPPERYGPRRARKVFRIAHHGRPAAVTAEQLQSQMLLT